MGFWVYKDRIYNWIYNIEINLPNKSSRCVSWCLRSVKSCTVGYLYKLKLCCVLVFNEFLTRLYLKHYRTHTNHIIQRLRMLGWNLYMFNYNIWQNARRSTLHVGTERGKAFTNLHRSLSKREALNYPPSSRIF